jgi:hypothetical protein
MLAASPSRLRRSITLRGLPRPGSSDDNDTVCIVMVLLLGSIEMRQAAPFAALRPLLSPIKKRVRMHPLALAESGWVWVGAGSRPVGLRTGRAIPGLRRDAALPVRHNTRHGREGGALPKALDRSFQRASLGPEAGLLVRPYFVETTLNEMA